MTEDPRPPPISFGHPHPPLSRSICRQQHFHREADSVQRVVTSVAAEAAELWAFISKKKYELYNVKAAEEVKSMKFALSQWTLTVRSWARKVVRIRSWRPFEILASKRDILEDWSLEAVL